MKKGQELEGIVTKVSFPNKGTVVTEEEETLLVKGVLPEQKVSVRVQKTRKGKAQGRLLEVVARAPYEIEPQCKHFESCGGCSYQTLSYEKQIELKEQQVKELMIPVLGADVFDRVWEGIKKSPKQWEYRNKMEFTFGDEVKDGPLALGMHKKGGFYDIVTVEHCQIVDEDIRKILKETLSFFEKKEISFYHKMQHQGYLRNLLVRKAQYTQEILVDLVTSTQMEDNVLEEELLQQWKEQLLSLSLQGSFAGILHTKNDRQADVVEDQGTTVLYGKDWFEEKLLGLTFEITPFSFFQTNSLGAEVLYQTAREFLMGQDKEKFQGKTLFDLYSGTGTIAQVLAPVAGQVIGVEIVEEAVEAAKKNGKKNGLTNCSFIAGDVLKVLDEISEKPDYIVLDPPRDGIHPKALQKIIDYGVESMIYISCKPTSLARDLEVLLQQGYEVKRMACCDLFPETVHVETVVLMSKVK